MPLINSGIAARAAQAMEEQDWIAAAALWQDLAELGPFDPKTYLNAAMALRMNRRFEECETILLAATAHAPDDLDLAVEAARAAEAAEHADEAALRWARVRARDPSRAPPERSGVLRRAWQSVECGNLRHALDLLQSLGAPGDDPLEATLRRTIESRLSPPSPERPGLLWRSGTQDGWEREWLMTLFAGKTRDAPSIGAGEHVVVVDNRLTAEKAAWYRTASREGCRITLVHLSDEAFEDDLSAYDWCDCVLRNYWGPLVARRPGVVCFGLGYKTGFVTERPPRPSGARPLAWSFAGDPNKSTRPAMLEAMRRVPGGAEHLTSGFAATDALSTGRYRDMMDDSLFVPCPAGGVSLDSFRVYEALEAGCIPLVERREGFDYFRELFSDHPLPTVLSWSEAPELIARLSEFGSLEALRVACHEWWLEYKAHLGRRVASLIS